MEKPNLAAKFCSPVEPYYYDVRYDRNGFRNAAEIYRADIAVLGDSYIEGIQTSGDDTLAISSVLQRYMNASVVNLGRSGYGPQQELAVLKRYAVPVSPKVIVWAFYEGNDLVDLLEYEETIAQLKLDGPDGSALDRSFLRNSLTALWEVWFKCKPDSNASLIAGDYDERSGDTVQLLFGDLRPLTKRDLTALNKLGDIFAEAHRVSTQHGAELVVAFLPGKIRVYKDVIRTPENSKLPAEIDDLPQRMQNLVADISPHIGFVDLTPAFIEAVNRSKPLFLENDTHWTELGHQVAARTIHEHLQRELSSGAEVSPGAR
ncbi:MAG: alginate O-acetyltransferase AlgX-related protein [Gammaproteobacteria bacterium]